MESLRRFVGYPKETAGYYFYDPSKEKTFVSRNAVFLEKDFPVDSRWDEVLLEEASEAPQQNDATSFEPLVPTDSVPVFCKLTRESRPLKRLVAQGYTQRPGVDLEENYSPVAMAMSIRILLTIVACRTVSLPLEKNRKSVVSKGPSMASNKLPKIGTHVFDEVISGYDFIKNKHDPCAYKKISGSTVVYLVLYADNILFFGNDVKMLGDIKAWLST
ncbi:UNVERIFIED_CONTAM: Retrovirus-related Pol polyprotein from transposon RE1 [Sesamum angustifolium]|uniref:Retrovirus-related Pol polyprotein from transposon RE1 n=1 Tax=Sesamum angustifolium TaxID=2727405 RepID=A0AAW2J007_9LAMI